MQFQANQCNSLWCDFKNVSVHGDVIKCSFSSECCDFKKVSIYSDVISRKFQFTVVWFQESFNSLWCDCKVKLASGMHFPAGPWVDKALKELQDIFVKLWPLLFYSSRNWASLNFSNIVTNYEESRNIWEIVWFGWPFKKKPFTIHLITIKGISYKRCASKYSVFFLCKAFEIITWNYNFRPSIFLCLVECVPTIKGVLGRLWNNQKIWPRPYLAFYRSCR